MATFSEDRVDFGITLVRDAAGDHVILSARTFNVATGVQIRRVRRDVTDTMSAARMTGIAALLDDSVAYLKQQLALPADAKIGPDITQ